MRGGEMPLFFRWNPALREASDDVRQAWRLATARTIDSFQNSGFLAGAAETSTAQVVGEGLELRAKPNAAALGWSQADANAWARPVEERFWMWASSARACDAGARFTLGQILAQGYRHWMATGEVLATLPWITRPGSQFGTKVRLLPAWRLANRNEPPDLVQGVRLDGSGAARGYVLKSRNQWGEEEIEAAARDEMGRPLVIHVFDGEPDQVRGISPFTPALKVVRQFDQLADATLTAALIQTVFAAMFKSEAPTDEVVSAMQEGSQEQENFEAMLNEKSKWYEKTDVNLGIHGKILHGFPGDDLQMFRSEHPNSTYEPFAKFLLREASRVTALTTEDFTGDYAGVTFSSIKMALTSNWPRVLYRRRYIVQPLAQAAYEAWLEEDIERGATPFPGGVEGFLANREAAAGSVWRGPPKPHPDDLKAALAVLALQEAGFSDAFVMDEYGVDVDDEYEQRAREQARRAELGLAERGPALASAVALASQSGQMGD
jgi:lambda family phage portal protein